MWNRSGARFAQLGIAALVAVIGAGCATKKTEASPAAYTATTEFTASAGSSSATSPSEAERLVART
jgi:hypothetical protein